MPSHPSLSLQKALVADSVRASTSLSTNNNIGSMINAEETLKTSTDSSIPHVFHTMFILFT